MVDTKFKKGLVPWNKGKKGLQVAWNKGKSGIFTQEQLKRISKAKKGKSPWNKGIPMSEELRRKSSEAHKGQIAWNKDLSKYTDKRIKEYALKMSGKNNSHYGKSPWNKGKKKIYTQEQLNRMSEAHKGQIAWNKGKTGIYSEETRRKIGLAGKGRIPWNLGKSPSEETIKKQKETFRKTMSNSEVRKRLSEAIKKSWSNPELRKRQSEVHKGKPSPRRGKKFPETSEPSRKRMLKQYDSGKFPLQQNTKPERKIKEELLKRGYKESIDFIHQYKFMNKFMCDFCFPQQKLIIEVDGDFWHTNPKKYPTGSPLHQHQIKNLERDKSKSSYITKVDNSTWTLLRFWESDINKNVAKCVDRIEEVLKEKIK